MRLKARATEATSSPPPSEARADSSPSPKRRAASSKSRRRFCAGRNTASDASAVPAASSAASPAASQGASSRATDPSGRPRATSTAATARPSTRTGAIAHGGQAGAPLIRSGRSPRPDADGRPRGRPGLIIGGASSQLSTGPARSRSRVRATIGGGGSRPAPTTRPSSNTKAAGRARSAKRTRATSARSAPGSPAAASASSSATRRARSASKRGGITSSRCADSHRKSPPCATSITARNAMKPAAMRQYRLRYQRRAPAGVALDIGALIACAPHREHERR